MLEKEVGFDKSAIKRNGIVKNVDKSCKGCNFIKEFQSLISRLIQKIIMQGKKIGKMLKKLVGDFNFNPKQIN